MILLKGHSLTPERKMRLEALSLQLSERDSTATLTTDDITGIDVNSWLQDDTDPGKGIVWRVKGIRQAFTDGAYTLQLEHMVSKLKERILFGEIKTETLAGSKGAKTVTAKKAVQYILGKQSDWVLGSFAFSDSNPYQFDGDSLFDALETISDSLEGCWWSYDFSVYPFKINFTKKSDSIGTVLRAGRNLETVNKSVDRNGMITRIYPIGKDDLHLDGDGHVSRNTGTWGVIEKTETDQTITTKAELKRWAQEKLKKSAEPVVSVEVDALELADATGETLDRLRLGRMCSIPLGDYGTQITETITNISYPDKAKAPMKARMTLANERRDVTKIVAEAIKRAGGRGRAAARQQKEDHAWFEDTDTHVAMVAEGIVGKDKDGNPNWSRLSKLVVDGKGISSTVENLDKTVGDHSTKITQNEKEISAEIKARKNGDSGLETKIQANAGKISLVVSSKNGKNSINTAGIVLAINSAGKSVALIKASRINLEGYVTAKELAAEKARLDKLISGDSNFDFLHATKASLGNSNSTNVSIYGRTVRVYSVEDTNGVTRQVFGYTL